MTPKYGNCKDCAAWDGGVDFPGIAQCMRHPPVFWDGAHDWVRPHVYGDFGCFDHIPKEEGNG